jgi:hypothetical protein
VPTIFRLIDGLNIRCSARGLLDISLRRSIVPINPHPISVAFEGRDWSASFGAGF